MLFSHKSQITGAINTMELDITETQLTNFKNGMFVQEAFPHLSPDEREFILTGVTPEEWDKYMGCDDID